LVPVYLLEMGIMVIDLDMPGGNGYFYLLAGNGASEYLEGSVPETL
jgi:hypothetical protein